MQARNTESEICNMEMNGKQLKQARNRLGLSQSRLGEAIGMTREMIGLMERGDKQIERRTELSIRWLLYEDGVKKID